MEFEYDSAKSESNKAKHGIDFVEAQELWLDQYAITFSVPYPVESRSILLAMYNEKLWAAVFTTREDRTRIISVRRARKNEERHYHEEE